VLQDWVGRFKVSAKGPRDLVTEADFASQREIKRLVLEAFPDHGFLGEESLPEAETLVKQTATGLRWIVDPLDGTTNYVHGIPAYCVSVALARGNEILAGTIFDPVLNECFTAEAGGGARLNGAPMSVAHTQSLAAAVVAVGFPPHVTTGAPAVADFLAVVPHASALRRTGSTAINLAYVACGRFDAFWVRRIAPWDVAAGLLLVAEAGGHVATLAADSEAAICLDDPAFIAAATPALLEELRRLLPPNPH